MSENKTGFKITKAAQTEVVENLIEGSSLSFDFYLMLILSTVVVTLGLLVGNSAVITGGMLITPLLTPILTLSLGIVITDKILIYRSIKIISKSVAIILVVSLVFAFLFQKEKFAGQFFFPIQDNILYFLVAFVAGLAATFSWAKKNLSAMLPGIAIAVSLLPPLSLVSIGIFQFSIPLVKESLVTFLLNLFGIVLGSVIIFSLLNFHQSKKETVKAVKQEIKKEEKKEEKVDVSKIKKEIKKQVQEEVAKKIEQE